MQDAFRTLAETLPEAMLLVDVHKRVRASNLAADRLFGRGASALVGEPLTSLFDDPAERVTRWFGLCAGSTGMIPARLLVRGRAKRVVLAEGATIVGDLAAPTRDVVVRVRQEGTLLHRFAELNRRLDALGEEIARRTHAEDALRRAQLRLYETNVELSRLAEHDPLTGISNRRGFDRALEQAIEEACRRDLGLALVLFDIDHFKRLNDASGHLEGDRCLVDVAALLGRVFRRADDVARIGGEEFAAVLVGLSALEAEATVGRALAALRDAAIPHPDSPSGPVVTMSAGVAFVRGQEAIHAPRLLQIADEALYEAKAKGRDRLCLRACL